MSRPNPNRITPTEMARALGKTNPDPIRAALRGGRYPVGCAYQGPGGRWVYDVPARRSWSLSEPAEYRSKGEKTMKALYTCGNQVISKTDRGQYIVYRKDGQEPQRCDTLQAAILRAIEAAQTRR